LFSTLAYPLFGVCFVVWFFSLCDDHQFIDVSRCEKYSWSTGRWRFCCLTSGLAYAFALFFFFWAMAHVLFGLWALFFERLSLFLYTFFLASWCALVIYEVVFILQDCSTILFCVTLPLIWINN